MLRKIRDSSGKTLAPALTPNAKLSLGETSDSNRDLSKTIIKKEIIEEEDIVSDEYVTELICKATKRIPGSSFIIGIKPDGSSSSRSPTYDCVLCYQNKSVPMSPPVIKTHIHSRQHLLNVMTVENSVLYAKYRHDQKAPATVLWDDLLRRNQPFGIFQLEDTSLVHPSTSVAVKYSGEQDWCLPVEIYRKNSEAAQEPEKLLTATSETYSEVRMGILGKLNSLLSPLKLASKVTETLIKKEIIEEENIVSDEYVTELICRATKRIPGSSFIIGIKPDGNSSSRSPTYDCVLCYQDKCVSMSLPVIKTHINSRQHLMNVMMVENSALYEKYKHDPKTPAKVLWDDLLNSESAQEPEKLVTVTSETYSEVRMDIWGKVNCLLTSLQCSDNEELASKAIETLIKKEIIEEENIVSDEYVTELICRATKRIPGSSFIIGIKPDGNSSSRSPTYDCVLCYQDKCVSLSLPVIKTHINSRQHLMNVMMVENSALYEKYRADQKTPAKVLWDDLLNIESVQKPEKLVTATLETYSEVRMDILGKVKCLVSSLEHSGNEELASKVTETLIKKEIIEEEDIVSDDCVTELICKATKRIPGSSFIIGIKPDGGSSSRSPTYDCVLCYQDKSVPVLPLVIKAHIQSRQHLLNVVKVQNSALYEKYHHDHLTPLNVLWKYFLNSEATIEPEKLITVTSETYSEVRKDILGKVKSLLSSRKCSDNKELAAKENKLLTQKEPVADTQNITVDSRKSVMRIPGSSFIIGIKLDWNDSSSSATYNCVLCCQDKLVRMSPSGLETHIHSREHLVKVMRVENAALYEKYRQDQRTPANVLWDELLISESAQEPKQVVCVTSRIYTVARKQYMERVKLFLPSLKYSDNKELPTREKEKTTQKGNIAATKNVTGTVPEKNIAATKNVTVTVPKENIAATKNITVTVPKENIAATKTVTVTVPKENIAATKNITVTVPKENIAATKTVTVTVPKENIAATKTVTVTVPKENIAATKNITVTVPKENIAATKTVTVTVSKENIAATKNITVTVPKENIAATKTVTVTVPKENIAATKNVTVTVPKENIAATKNVTVTIPKVNIAATKNVTVKGQTNVKKIPGSSFIIGIKSEGEGGSKSPTYDCVLCNQFECVTMSLSAMKAHIHSREHLIKVMLVEKSSLYEKYRHDYSTPESDLYDVVLNSVSDLESKKLVIATSGTYSNVRKDVLGKVINLLPSLECLGNKDLKANENEKTTQKGNIAATKNVTGTVPEENIAATKNVTATVPKENIAATKNVTVTLPKENIAGTKNVTVKGPTNVKKIPGSSFIIGIKLEGEGGSKSPTYDCVLCNQFESVTMSLSAMKAHIHSREHLIKVMIVGKSSLYEKYRHDYSTPESVLYDVVLNSVSDHESKKLVIATSGTYSKVRKDVLGKVMNLLSSLECLGNKDLKANENESSVEKVGRNSGTQVSQIDAKKSSTDSAPVLIVEGIKSKDVTKKSVSSACVGHKVTPLKKLATEDLKEQKAQETIKTSSTSSSFYQYSMGQLLRVHYNYKTDVEKIRYLQSNRNPKNIVLVSNDEKYFDNSLTTYHENVWCLRQKDVYMENIRGYLESHPQFDKGTVFVLAFGVMSLLQPVPFSSCVTSGCQNPLMLYKVPQVSSDVQYLVRTAISLNLDVLNSTVYDTVVFAGMIPIDITDYNKELVKNRACAKYHYANDLLPCISSNSFRDFLATIEWYNEFTKYHALRLGYTPWDMEAPFFSQCGSSHGTRKIMLKDPSQLLLQRDEVRTKKVKCLCSEILLKYVKLKLIKSLVPDVSAHFTKPHTDVAEKGSSSAPEVPVLSWNSAISGYESPPENQSTPVAENRRSPPGYQSTPVVKEYRRPLAYQSTPVEEYQSPLAYQNIPVEENRSTVAYQRAPVAESYQAAVAPVPAQIVNDGNTVNTLNQPAIQQRATASNTVQLGPNSAKPSTSTSASSSLEESMITIMKLQENRAQNRIVLVTDERDNFELSMTLYDSRISIIKLPGLNFSNALQCLKSHTSYGKGTIFVFSCGISLLTQTLTLPDCQLNSCRYPQTLLSLSKDSGDMHHLVDAALKLNMSVLQSTCNDIVLFSGLVPIHINNHNIYVIQNRPCLMFHPAERVPVAKDYAYAGFLETVKWYNEFTKYHARKLGFLPWDLETPFFWKHNSSDSDQVFDHKKLHANGYNIPANLERKRVKKVEFLCSDLLQYHISVPWRGITQDVALHESNKTSKFEQVVILGDQRYMPWIKHYSSLGVIVLVDQVLKTNMLKNYIITLQKYHQKNTLYLVVSGIFTLTRAVQAKSCYESKCQNPLPAIQVQDEYLGVTRNKNHMKEQCQNLVSALENIEKSLPIASKIALLPPLPVSFICSPDMSHKQLHDMHCDFPDYMVVNEKTELKNIYSEWMQEFLNLSLASCVRHIENTASVLQKLMVDQFKQLQIMNYLSDDKPTYNLWKEVVGEIIAELPKSADYVSKKAEMQAPSLSAPELAQIPLSEQSKIAGDPLTSCDHIVFIGDDNARKTLPNLGSCNFSYWKFINMKNSQQLQFEICDLIAKAYKNVLFIIIGDMSLLGYEEVDHVCKLHKCGHEIKYFSTPCNESVKVKECLRCIRDMAEGIKRYSCFQYYIVLAPFCPRNCIRIPNQKWLGAFHTEMHKVVEHGHDCCFLLGSEVQWDKICKKIEIEWKSLRVSVLPANSNKFKFISKIMSAISAGSHRIKLKWKTLSTCSLNPECDVLSKWKSAILEMIKHSWMLFSDVGNLTTTEKSASDKAKASSHHPTVPSSSAAMSNDSHSEEFTETEQYTTAKIDFLRTGCHLFDSNNRVAFSHAYIIGKESVVSKLSDLNVKLPVITFYISNFDTNDVQNLVHKIGLHKSGNFGQKSVCCLAFDFSVIAVNSLAAPTYYQLFVKKPVGNTVDPLVTPIPDAFDVKSYVSSHLQQVRDFSEKLSHFIPVLVLPLFPVRCFLDSCLRDMPSHAINDLRRIFIQGPRSTWDKVIETLTVAWNNLMEIYNASYECAAFINHYVDSKPRAVSIRDYAKDFPKECNESVIWKAFVESLLLALVPAKKRDDKLRRRKSRSNKVTVRITQLSPTIPEGFYEELFSACDPDAVISKNEGTYNLKRMKFQIAVLLVKKVNKLYLGDTTLLATILDEDERLTDCQLSLMEDLFISVIYKNAYNKYRRQIIENLIIEINKVPDVLTVKSRPCKEGEKCTRIKSCIYYHGPKDRRRDPSQYKYIDAICVEERTSNGFCRNDMQCDKCHNLYEMTFLPRIYQTSLCHSGLSAPVCGEQGLCSYAHKDSPELFYTNAWEDLVLFGTHHSLSFFTGAIRGVMKIMGNCECKVVLVSPCQEFLDTVAEVSADLIRAFGLELLKLKNYKGNPDSYDVLIGTPTDFENLNYELVESQKRGAVIVDAVDSILEDEHNKNALRTFFRRFFASPVNDFYNKVFISGTHDFRLTGAISGLTGLKLKEVCEQQSEVVRRRISVRRSSSTSSGYSPAEQKYKRRSKSHKKRSRSRSRSRNKRSKSHSSSSDSRNSVSRFRSQNMARRSSRSRSHDARMISGSVDKISTRRRRSSSRIRDHRRDKFGQKRSRSRSESLDVKRHKVQMEPDHPLSYPEVAESEKQTSCKVSYLRNLLGSQLFEEYSKSEEVVRQKFEDEFKIYNKMPELHPDYEKHFDTFTLLFSEKCKGRDEQFKEKLWNMYWLSECENIKEEDWKKQQLKLIQEYKAKISKSDPHPHSSDLQAASSSRDRGPYEFHKALALLEEINVGLGIMGSSLLAMVNSCRELGGTTKAGYEVFIDRENVALLHLALSKIRILSQSATGDLLNSYKRAIEWIPLLVEEAKMDLKNETVPINIDAIARVSVGKDPEFVMNLINTAFVYEGLPMPSISEQKELFLKVCSAQFNMRQ